MNKIKNIVIISLVLLSGVLAFLLYRSINESCECKCKECEEKKKDKPKLINSGEFERKRIERVSGLKDGYKVLGIATNKASYDKLTSDLSFEVIDYEYNEDVQTNCVSNGKDETNCISAKKVVEKDYDRYVYALIVFQIDECNASILYDGFYLNEYINLSFTETTHCGVCASNYYLYEIGIPRKNYNAQELNVEFTLEDDGKECDPDIAYKPIMYLYPTQDIDLSITFDKEELLTTTYPKYNNGWNVKVLKDGSIYDENNKYYYALYWESQYNYKVDFSEGFYVNKDNAIDFLEEKLTILGLNDKERNEFIMYWLPIIEKNEHNLIYFETTESLNKNEPINFSIKPDTLIRIRMHIKKVDKPYTIREQKLTSPTRSGFTAIEWGGVIY